MMLEGANHVIPIEKRRKEHVTKTRKSFNATCGSNW